MPRGRRYELDELIIRPGTYFNPQTEVMIVVDDSPSMDAEIFNMEEFEGADWVLISDDLPVDESARDELLETFQATHSGGDGRGHFRADSDDADLGLDEETDDEEELEPDPEEGGADFDEDE
jgi:hypothetical protein